MLENKRVDGMLTLLRRNGYSMQDIEMLGQVVNSDEFKDYARSIGQKLIKEPDPKVKNRIREIMKEMDIPGPRMGYCVEVIELAYQEVLEGRTLILKHIYRQVAGQHGVRDAYVNDQIAMAIEVCWRKRSIAIMKKYLGESLAKYTHRPQKKEFIQGIVRYLLKEENS